MIYRLHILQYSNINILLIGITSEQIKRSNRQEHTGKRTSRVYIITDYIKWAGDNVSIVQYIIN